MNTASSKTVPAKWLITLGLSGLFYLMPMGNAITGEIHTFLSITVCFILLVTFDLLPTLILSMLLPCAYMFSGIAPAATALAPWTNTLMYLVTAGIILSNVLADCGLLRRIALWFIWKCGGTIQKTVYSVYAICLIMALISFCQAWLLMFTLAIALCHAMGYQAGDKETTVIMMAAFCGALTSTVYVYNPAYAPLLETAYQAISPDTVFQWYHVTLYMCPYILVCLLFLWLLIRHYRIADNGSVAEEKAYLQDELKRMGPISSAEKKAALALIFLVLFLVTSSWHGQNILYGFMVTLLFLFLPGIEVGKKEAVTNVNMATIAFMVACMSIGTVAAYLGLDTIIASGISKILDGSGIYSILYVLFGLGAAVNFVMTPLAILTCLLSPIVKIAQLLGINPVGAIYTLYCSVDFYILPYENAWALVFFGLGMIRYKDFIKLNLLRSLMLTVSLGILFIPWWHLCGIL